MLSVSLTMVVHSVQLYMNVNTYKKAYFSCIATQNIVWVKMNNTVKQPFLRPFLAIFCQLYGYLFLKWDSDGHFEVLKESKSQLVQLLWQKIKKMQKTQMSVFVQNCKKPKMEIFAIFVITFEPIRF